MKAALAQHEEAEAAAPAGQRVGHTQTTSAQTGPGAVSRRAAPPRPRMDRGGACFMISVFAGFVGSHDAMIKALGFGLAIAVLFDAFVVRMTIVPATLALVGKRAWSLPAWIDRILPDVDIEGENLARQAAPPLPAQEQPEPVAPAHDHSGHR